MTGFIDNVVTAGRILGTLYKIVERFMDKTKFYTSRDTRIINAARKIYLEVFAGRPLPSELRYWHEPQEDEVVLPACPSEPDGGHYRPPYLLPATYSTKGVCFGEKEISSECRNAVLEIHDFLKKLNDKASEINLLSEYGHRNDAIRFIFYLLINAFVELSKMDLTDVSMLEEATLYIQFLFRLKHDENLNAAFRQIDQVQTGGSAHPQDKTPLAMLVHVHEALGQIKMVIDYHISQCGILKQAEKLGCEINSLISQSFTFSTYIISSSHMQEIDTVITSTATCGAQEPRSDLMTFRMRLSELLSDSNPHASIMQMPVVPQISDDSSSLQAGVMQAPVVVSQISDDSLRIAVPGFYLDERTGRWIGLPSQTLKSGVYVGFKERDIQEYTKFCVNLSMLGDLRVGILSIQQLLRDGGDVIAVTLLSRQIQATLKMLNDSVEAMDRCKIRLMASAESNFNALCGKTKPEKAERRWMNNYSALTTLLPTLTQQELLKNVRGAMSSILNILKDWRENPKQKIQVFQANQKNLNTVLKRVADVNPRYRRLVDALDDSGLERLLAIVGDRLVATQHSRRGAGSMLSDRVRVEAILDDDVGVDSHVQSGHNLITGRDNPHAVCISQIKGLLESYAYKNGYKMNLSAVAEKIRLLNANSMEKYKLTKADCIDENHRARAEWIYDAFVLLYATTLSEHDILERMLVHIENVRQDADSNKKFQSRDKNKGIEARMAQIYQLVNERLQALGSMQREEGLSMPIDYSDDDAVELGTMSSGEQSPSGDMPNPLDITFYREGVRPIPGVEEEHTETAEKYSGIVAEIAYWVNQSLGEGKTAVREQFMIFWNKLCFLDQSSKLEAYHARLHTVRALTGEETFLLKVQENLDDQHLQPWATQVAADLGGANVEPAEWVGTQIESTKRRLTVARKSAEKRRVGQWVPVTSFSGERDSIPLIWPLSRYKELAKAIEYLNEDQPGLYGAKRGSAMEPKKFLDSISYRLLQEKSRLYTPEQIQEESEQLTSYLSDLLELHSKRDGTVGDQQTPRFFLSSEEQAFCIEVARGLMSLGACPLKWMDKQVTLMTRVDTVNQNSAQGYFLAAKKVKLILSHIEVRASRFGECMLFLGAELNALIDSFVAFSNRLSDCVDSDNDLLWRLWVKLFYKKKETRPTGARYERAALFWAVLRYVYVIFNEELFQFDALDLNKKPPTALYQEAKNMLASAKLLYDDATTHRMRFYNRGTSTVAKLLANISAVEEKLAAAITTQRILLKSAMGAKAAFEVAQAAEQKTQAAEQKTRVAEQKTLFVMQRWEQVLQNRLTKALKGVFEGVAISSVERVQSQFHAIVTEIAEEQLRDVLEVKHMGLAIVQTDEAFSHVSPILTQSRSQARSQPVEEQRARGRDSQASQGLSRFGTFAASGSGQTNSASNTAGFTRHGGMDKNS